MTKNNFFKVVIVLPLLLNYALLNAQVTVGSNVPPNATLDVVASKTDGSTAEGIIAPRLTGDQIQAADLLYGDPQNAAIVYAIEPVSTPSPKTVNIKKAGYYYYDAPNAVWVAVNTGNEVWFYMPSFNLPLGTQVGAQRSFSLYKEYERQFKQIGNSQFVVSYNAENPANVVVPYSVSELEYFVTAYSDNVITITGLDQFGILYYTVNSLLAPEGSFINVIFKVK